MSSQNWRSLSGFQRHITLKPTSSRPRPSSLQLAPGDDHAADERVDDALVGAVRGVRRDRQVRLVGDREADDRAPPAEPADGGRDELLEPRDVALVALGRVVADLDLAPEPGERVVAHEPADLPDARGAVRPEEAVQAQDELPALRPQRLQRLGRLRRGPRERAPPAWRRRCPRAAA